MDASVYVVSIGLTKFPECILILESAGAVAIGGRDTICTCAHWLTMIQKQCLLLPHKLTKYSFLVVLQTGFHTRILIVSDCISSGGSQEENAGA